jgi:transcriptional regulator with XRE-family HTH domain
MRKLDDDDKELKIKIASRIKSLRKATGLLMTEYAKDNYKDKQSQSRLEKQGASIFTINKFCKEIGITLSEFFNDAIFKK